jgi:hypothetical protein
MLIALRGANAWEYALLATWLPVPTTGVRGSEEVLIISCLDDFWQVYQQSSNESNSVLRRLAESEKFCGTGETSLIIDGEIFWGTPF